MPRLFLAACFILLAACATLPQPAAAPGSLDAIAEDYVRLSLEIGTHEDGYVDAYYGPAGWRTEAEAAPRPREELLAAVRALSARTDALGPPDDALVRQRRLALLAQLRAADTRLQMMLGEEFDFAEEASGLFGVAPIIEPLESYDPVLARLEGLLPGEGDLADRVEAYRDQFTIPADRLDAVMRAAIAECRARTAAHIALPDAETFQLEFVTDQPWSGYNWYQGGAASLIQINTDLPIRIGRAVDLGCHEGYPGHHVFNMLLERNLVEQRGWIEYSVYPLFSPQSFIAEGSANYGIDLAFPGEARAAFEAETLYPLAGLDPARAAEYLAVEEAIADLAGARFTITRDYLEGRIDRDQAIALSRRYQLRSPEGAAQAIAFADVYRSYVINYGLGQDMVRAYIESRGDSPAERWAAMERLLSEPTLAQDLIIEGDE